MLRKWMCVLLSTLLLVTALSPMLVSAEVGDTIWKEWEPNDLPKTADPIYCDDTYIGTIGGDDLDLFVVQLPYATTVSIICSSSDATIVMGIFDNDLNILCSYSSGYEEGLYHNFIYRPLSAGTYYIALKNTDESDISEYLLYFYYAPPSPPPTTPTTPTTQSTQPTTTSTTQAKPSIHKHSFVSVEVAPTCMSYSYTLHTCSTCGYSYSDNYGDKKGAHVFSSNDNCDVCGVARADAPTVIAYNYSMVALQGVAGYEYSMNGVSFQPSPLFTGLSPSTTYYFCQRVAAKDGLPAGEISPAVKVVTDPTPTTHNSSTATTTTTKTAVTSTTSVITTTSSTDTVRTTTTASATAPDVVVLTHDKTGVQIRTTSDVLDGGCELFVYALSQSANETQLHIIVTKDGVGVQPRGNVFVYMPVPDGVSGDRFDVTVTRADGTVAVIDSTCQGGQLFFKTDSFGVLTIRSAAPEGTGDIDGNGTVSIADAVQLYYHVNGKIALPDTANADITKDNKVSIADAVQLYYYVNGKTDIL